MYSFLTKYVKTGKDSKGVEGFCPDFYPQRLFLSPVLSPVLRRKK